MAQLNELKLLAQGGQAQVYQYEEGKVLRVLRNPEDADMLQNEIDIMRALKAYLNVPEVYDLINIDGRPAAVVQKIEGPSMLDYIRRHPLKLAQQASLLARLHLELPENIDLVNLHPEKERARYLIGRATIDIDMKEFVFRILNGLSEGAALCHGDFHPGNILKSGEKSYMIDWFGAYKGSLLSDAAHSYLLMKIVPKYPGVGAVQYQTMKMAGSLLAERYLNAFYKMKPFDWTEFSERLVIKAAERIYHGFETEKAQLISFINSCRNNSLTPASWYKLLK